MTKINEYTIATSINQLTDLINEKIKEGCQPIGGVTITTIAVFGEKAYNWSSPSLG